MMAILKKAIEWANSTKEKEVCEEALRREMDASRRLRNYVRQDLDLLRKIAAQEHISWGDR